MTDVPNEREKELWRRKSKSGKIVKRDHMKVITADFIFIHASKFTFNTFTPHSPDSAIFFHLSISHCFVYHRIALHCKAIKIGMHNVRYCPIIRNDHLNLNLASFFHSTLLFAPPNYYLYFFIYYSSFNLVSFVKKYFAVLMIHTLELSVR